MNSGYAPRQSVMLVDRMTERGSMKNLMQRFIREEDGQDLIEYAFLAAFIAIVALVAVKLVGTGVNTAMQNVATQLGS